MPVITRPAIDLDWVRSRFPALAGEWAFLDNAGGSQTLDSAARRTAEYLLESNVSHSAPNELSRKSRGRVEEAQARLAVFMNAADPSEMVMGPSSTQLLQNLGLSLGGILEPGDEIVAGNTEHYSNVSPWERLQKSGVVLKFWNVNPETWRLEFEDLAPLLTDRCRLVAFTHCSNILGTIHDAKSLVARIRARGIRTLVDGVAYAPHRAIDVRDLDTDFYVWSVYKVFGPHHAVLYGRKGELLALPGINYSFLPADMIPYKFQPGNVNPEVSWGSTAVVDYFEELGGRTGSTSSEPRARIEAAFEAIAAHEEALAARFLAFVMTSPRIRVFGKTSPDRRERVATISFVIDGIRSYDVPARLGERKIMLRSGDFYARPLINDLGLRETGGVVRASFVHYNTFDDVDRLIEGLSEILADGR